MEEHDDAWVGRTERRRARAHPHRHAEQLVGLTDPQLHALDLPETIRQEIRLARDIPRSGARKRQLAFVDKLLRQLDEPELEALAAALQDTEALRVAGAHALDALIAHLLASDDALTAFLGAHPQADAQRLRQLIRNARKEQAKGSPGRGHRALGELLREMGAPGSEAP